MEQIAKKFERKSWRVVQNANVLSPNVLLAGKPFLDFSMVALDSRREMRFSDLVKAAGARPLVLNFGSCS